MSKVGRWKIAFAATATLLGGCASSAPFQPIAISLNPSSAQAFDQSVSEIGIKATLTNDVNSEGVSWTLNGVGSLSSSTNLFNGYYPPNATITSAQQVTVTARSIADPTKSASVQITVNPNPYIPYQSLANGTIGVPYSQTVALAGGTAPIQWGIFTGPIGSASYLAGAVPDGLTLNTATGTISGIPTAAGTWYFEASATDADNAISYDGFLSVQISPAGTSNLNPVPFLNQTLVPTAVSPGGSGLTLKVSGAGFVFGATMNFNGSPLTTTFVDSDHLTAYLPAMEVATAKTASVTVVNPAPGGSASNTVFFQVGVAETTVNFVSANSLLQGTEPSTVAVADFNEDGKPDLAIAANIRTYVALGNGDGTFTSAPGFPIFMPKPPYEGLPTQDVGLLAVGDFNHSGHQGLAVGEYQNGAAAILLGNGTGTLSLSSAEIANSGGLFTYAFGAADFNADGYLDLAFTNETGESLQTALGYGKGAFNLTPGSYAIPSPEGAAVGDFDGDGKLDLAVAGPGTNGPQTPGSIAIAFGNGDGTFHLTGASPISLGLNLTAIVAGDFNGDGKLDLAAADYTENAVFLLLGNGNGTFQTPIRIAVGNGPDALVAGDFNNDGKLDIATANYGDGTVTLLLGKGDGTFTQALGSPYVVGGNPLGIAAADFNGDGKLDLAVANGTNVSILLQR